MRVSPLLRPVIVTTLPLSVGESINLLDFVYVMSGGGPNASTEVTATYMSRLGPFTFRCEYAIATLLLSLAAALSVLIRTRRAERTP